MRTKMHRSKLAAILLLLSLTVNIATSVSTPVRADDRKTVRIGWHEPPYFITDQFGRQSGYSYEYQLKVAAYTGWEYEYVEGTWTDLFEMLKLGKIDVLSDVSYTEERSKEMIYTSIPMGTEAYYVFVSPNNTEITADDLSTLNGKKVAVTEDSIQKDFFKDWAAAHNITVDIVELNCDSEEAIKHLDERYDAYVTMDTFGSPETAIPICKVGSSDFFFAVSKKRPDLAAELDAALNRIQDENKYYDQQLHDKYLKSDENNKYLSNTEKEWLSEHGTIRVGYQDNYLAFCARDPETGELTGALKDYLDYASTAFVNGSIDFETVAYATASDAIDALKRGEIDCVFPSNLTGYDAEQLDLVISPPLMRTQMNAVVRESSQKEFLMREDVVVAVNEGNTNYDMFLADNYPEWERTYFNDTPAGLEAVAAGIADCLIISDYRYSNISKQCEQLHLTTVYTGVDMDFAFATREGETDLYSVLARVTGVVPDNVIHSALTYYSTEDVKTSLGELIKDNLFIISTVIAVVLLIILLLLVRSIRAQKKIVAEERLVKDLNRLAFVDSLTSVRNNGAYNEFLKKLQDRLDSGEKIEFAICICDCNDLKKINDQFGHDKGDIYLKNACRMICEVFDHSPVFRMGGDEFAIFLQNGDYVNRDALAALFEEKQAKMNEAVTDKWDEVHVALGIAVYDPGLDKGVSDTVHRADKIMYENKRKAKESGQ
ncbi:diguanylate cyclase (GGDEF) domain-containing protein [Ruminococcaceae bacterium YRB3002]|nr:diguanylate cyclase (GGDEF) domain-containing protein [Ruminococcaceae bacterium YRB3002]